MEKYYVYRHVNKINGKQYIGITKNQPEKRWGYNGIHYTAGKKNYFANAIRKYGWDNFTHEILFEGLTKEEACEKEIELIKKYNTMDARYGYNSTSGGEVPAEITEEVRKKEVRGSKRKPTLFRETSF